MMDRRLFNQTLGLTALTATVPSFLHKTGTALASDEKKNDCVLVVIQLGGGNDGLNQAVLPADVKARIDSAYRRFGLVGG